MEVAPAIGWSALAGLVSLLCASVLDVFAGIAEQLRAVLAAVPESERALLELRAVCPGLGEREALVAAHLRMFLVTWDPLGWMRDRGMAWATASGDGDSFEVVLYATLENAVRRARERGQSLVDVIGELAGSVVAVGGAHQELLVSGAYAQLSFAGEVAGLLSAAGSAARPAAFKLELAAAGWEPIGLGEIQDLVQEHYGPVDLDRSVVRLAPAGQLALLCPACAGERFGFPAELDRQRKAMCAEHAAQAQAIIDARLKRAPASNRGGWDAIVGASSMLSEPTFGLPLWLVRDLQRASDRDQRAPASEQQLRADAALALELAARLASKPEVFVELVMADVLSDVWILELPMALASRGLVDEAVTVGDALSELDADNHALFASDVAVILAQAGRRDQALARVQRNLSRFPDDIWTHIHAGDVHLALSDRSSAERAFRDALAIARAHGDASGVADANQRLAQLLVAQRGREQETQAATREMRRASRAAYAGLRLAVKVGRNEPCPCGSGRKYKRCCGAR